ncbi:MAG: GNAT family N-acetyltransferase [Monoglobales bacterium]
MAVETLDFFFNHEYAKLYENIDGASDTFFLECEHGKIQHTFILREIKWSLGGKTYYDIVTPYGYGGPIILECTDILKLMEAYRKAFAEYCSEHNIICEFIRFHLFDNVDFRENYYGETQRMLDNVVVNTTGAYDDIWMRYEHKVRKNVKKAQSNGLEMIVENDLSRLDDFLRIYYGTMERNNAKQYYYFKRGYFEDIARRIPQNFMYFHVIKDDSVISTELVLFSDKYAYSFLGGTVESAYSVRPNDFLKDAIIKWCNETGREIFVLGGGYRKDDGIYKYKRSFTDSPDVPFYIGKSIFDRKIYDEMVSLRAAEDKDFDRESAYFPLYRA